LVDDTSICSSVFFLSQLEILSALIEAKLPLLPKRALLRERASDNATSPSCVSMIVLVQLANCASGGMRTRVMIGGTNSEKCRETKVDTRLDLPTLSVKCDLQLLVVW
jgi:hypothetical protein